MPVVYLALLLLIIAPVAQSNKHSFPVLIIGLCATAECYFPPIYLRFYCGKKDGCMAGRLNIEDLLL